jgi:predicted ester cyclase
MVQNKEIIQQLFSEVISRKTGISPQNNGTDFAQPLVPARTDSLNAFYEFFEAIGEAFPDYALTIDNMVVAEDKVMVRYTVSGTQKGKLLGMVPTHEKLMVTGIDIFSLSGGEIIQHWETARQVNALNRGSSIIPTLNGSARVWHPPKASLTASG